MQHNTSPRIHVATEADVAGIKPVEGAYGVDMSNAKLLAKSFYVNGIESYSEVVKGEEDMKVMYIALLAMGAENGMGGVSMGVPGTGKSLMNKYGHKLVGDIEDDEVANVPHRPDLQAAELVGKSGELTRTTKDGTEVIGTKLTPIIKEGIRVVNFDEITRTSPHALNGAMTILQDGKIVVGEDGKVVSGFDLVASTTNNYGTLYTSPLDPAIISRHAMGVFVGERVPGQATEAGKSPWLSAGVKTLGEKTVKAVIDTEGLHAIRAAIPYVNINEQEANLGIKMQTNLLDIMQAEGKVVMGDGRFAAQAVRIAQTLALLRNRKDGVTEQDLQDTFRFAATAKLGLAGAVRHSSEVESIINKLG